MKHTNGPDVYDVYGALLAGFFLGALVMSILLSIYSQCPR